MLSRDMKMNQRHGMSDSASDMIEDIGSDCDQNKTDNPELEEEDVHVGRSKGRDIDEEKDDATSKGSYTEKGPKEEKAIRCSPGEETEKELEQLGVTLRSEQRKKKQMDRPLAKNELVHHNCP